MASPAQDPTGLPDALLSRVKLAIEVTKSRWMMPFGISITHILSSSFVQAMNNLSEVSLAADIDGDPDYFDLLGAEEAIATELGLEVRIIPKRAVWDSTRPKFETSMVAL